MFNLIKILNGRLNVPEIVEVKVYVDSYEHEYGIHAGCVYYIESSSIVSYPSSSKPIMFIPTENIPVSEYTDPLKIKGFYPDSNMIFETEIGFGEDDYYEDDEGNWVSPEKIEVKCGDVLSIGKINKANDSVRYELGAGAKVIDNTDYENTNKLLVLLKW